MCHYFLISFFVFQVEGQTSRSERREFQSRERLQTHRLLGQTGNALRLRDASSGSDVRMRAATGTPSPAPSGGNQRKPDQVLRRWRRHRRCSGGAVGERRAAQTMSAGSRAASSVGRGSGASRSGGSASLRRGLVSPSAPIGGGGGSGAAAMHVYFRKVQTRICSRR